MNTLFLDLASHSALPDEGACVACVDETHAKAIHFIDHRIGDQGILPAVEYALAAATWKLADLTHIACVAGPGGFTSLRMAVALANTLADQLNIPLAGVHLSDLYSARFHVETPRRGVSTTDWIWLHSTKKIELFIRGFGKYSKQWPEPTLMSLDALVDQYPNGASFAGELLPEQRDRLISKGLQDVPLKSIAEALPDLLKGAEYKKQILLPWYGRGW